MLHLTTPHTKGQAVTRLQRAVNARLARRHSTIRVDVDGDYGQATRNAEVAAAYLLGVKNPHNHRRAQAVILRPGLRWPPEVRRGRRRVAGQARRVTSGPAGAVALALRLARTVPHYTENPAGSNTDRGGIIDQAQHEVGISGTFYCGAGVHYMVLHGGGVNITPEVRYCPSIEAHAKAGTGGLAKWLPVSAIAEWRPGDILTFDEGGVAGHTELLVDVSHGVVHTVGWNTSPQDGSGSQSNGGGVFERHRPVGGGFPVRGAARVRWAA